MIGIVRRRLLLSTWVDPHEAAHLLPSPLRPHIVDGRTVVGCCVLELESVRPAGVPAPIGRSVTAMAHRVAAEWEGVGGPVAGVFVPIRHTGSTLASVVGGRLVPGVQRRVPFRSSWDGGRLTHIVDADDSSVEVSVVDGPTSVDAPGPDVCLSATIGLSPTIGGGLDAIDMRLSGWTVRPMSIVELESPFIAGFSTRGDVSAHLMEGATARWRRGVSPDPSLHWPLGSFSAGRTLRHGRRDEETGELGGQREGVGVVGVEAGLQHDAVGAGQHE